MKVKFILIFLFIILTRAGTSQPWYFNNIYNPNNTWAGGLSIIATNDGYFGCAISSDSISNYYYNICPFRISFDGELISWKSYGKPGFDYYPGYYGSLIETNDSCFASFGSEVDLSIGLSHGLLSKIRFPG